MLEMLQIQRARLGTGGPSLVHALDVYRAFGAHLPLLFSVHPILLSTHAFNSLTVHRGRDGGKHTREKRNALPLQKDKPCT